MNLSNKYKDRLPCFFFYREPGCLPIIYTAEDCKDDLYHEGFSIESFYNDKESMLTIPLEYRITFDQLDQWYNLYLQFSKEKRYKDKLIYRVPDCSTNRDTHKNALRILQGNFESDRHKVISSTVTVINDKIQNPLTLNFSGTINKLCEEMPNACVMVFYTPQSGLWITATPELLLRSSYNPDVLSIETMSLAGTRKADCKDPWDSKNIIEQSIVTEYITQVLKDENFNVRCSLPTTRIAGDIEHICTEIRGDKKSPDPVYDLSRLLSILSPTPALCGFPRDKAYRLISETESFSRSFYGGWAGINNGNGSLSLWVNLRTALICDKIFKFAGGGITIDSDPDSEWEETRRKVNQLSLIFK